MWTKSNRYRNYGDRAKIEATWLLDVAAGSALFRNSFPGAGLRSRAPLDVDMVKRKVRTFIHLAKRRNLGHR